MQKNPFMTLGVDENVTQNELFEAYKNLRNEYSDKRFSPGEEGADACRKLEEIEQAYSQAADILRSKYEITYYGDNLIGIEDAIKNNDLDKAQDLLDTEQNRTARWHYLQSVVFYRKNWYSEALRQLEFACNLEPNNPKYTEAKESLIKKMQSEGQQRHSFYNDKTAQDGGRSYRDVPPTGRRTGCTACDCCTSLICADCCCECMGGDLITCC